MKRRKHRYRGYSKRTIVLLILLFCSLFFGLGYSLLGTSLDLSGIITVKKYDKTLYGVMKKNFKKGFTRKYNNSHFDSMDTSLSTEDIYYWYAPSNNNTLANQILDKNNVLFADHCWQMIRTTDTGGVKLIYNGEASSGRQCLTSRGNHVGFGSLSTQTLSSDYYYSSQYYYDSTNSTFKLRGIIEKGEIKEGYFTCKSTSVNDTCSILYMVVKQDSGSNYYIANLKNNSNYSVYGNLPYNVPDDSIAYIGYMYNKAYKETRRYPSRDYFFHNYSVSPSYTYYFSDSVVYNNGTYVLQNPVSGTWTDMMNNVSGYYTCMERGTSCSTLYYIQYGGTSTFYGIKMDNGHTINDFNLNLGKNYIDNGDGTYTLGDIVSIPRSDWYNNYSDYNNYYFCLDGSNTCSGLRFITQPYSYYYDYLTIEETIFSESFTYSNGKYTLTGDKGDYWDNYSDITNFLSNHHYSCLNNSLECTTIFYVFYASRYDYYYIELENGKSVEDAKNEMFYNDDVNTYSSIAKIGSEAWYRQFLLSYNDYLEDIVFCNNRRLYSYNATTNGWNANGGDVTDGLHFEDSYSLGCINDTDKFSISNSKARLDYPVGLINNYEMHMFENSLLSNVGKEYWTATPSHWITYGKYIRSITASGYTNNTSPIHSFSTGFRWVVSLKPGTEYLSGDGSTSNPYVIDDKQNTTFTIYYRYSDGGEAAPNYVGIYKPGEPFSIPSPTIENYDTMNHVVSGTKAPGNQSATVWYTYNGGSIIDPDTPLDP